MKHYIEKIEKFNKMYELPINDQPTNLGKERFKKLQSILQEELNEGDEILAKFGERPNIEILVDIADWLCDIIVYCSTFSKSWGIPIEEVLEIIMDSNFSKLDGNGNVIKDERGKVMKGENYWKPEPKIRELFIKMFQEKEANRVVETVNEKDDEEIVRRIS